MAVTVHWLDREKKQRVLIIGFESFHSRYSGVATGKLTMSIMQPFYEANQNFSSKLLAKFTENASNNNGLVEYSLDVQAINDRGCHVRCSAHCVNLAANDVLACIHCSTKKLRTLFKTVRHRREADRTLARECKRGNEWEDRLHFGLSYAQLCSNLQSPIGTLSTRSDTVQGKRSTHNTATRGRIGHQNLL